MKQIILACALLLCMSARSAPSVAMQFPVREVPPACAQPVFPNARLYPSEPPVHIFAFLIDTDGKVMRSQRIRSSGINILDGAVHDALSRCTYPPLQVAGKHVSGWIQVRYEWVID